MANDYLIGCYSGTRGPDPSSTNASFNAERKMSSSVWNFRTTYEIPRIPDSRRSSSFRTSLQTTRQRLLVVNTIRGERDDSRLLPLGGHLGCVMHVTPRLSGQGRGLSACYSCSYAKTTISLPPVGPVTQYSAFNPNARTTTPKEYDSPDRVEYSDYTLYLLSDTVVIFLLRTRIIARGPGRIQRHLLLPHS